MREYRYYNNIKWGKKYNPQTQAHHQSAANYDDARNKIPNNTDAQSIQVKTAQGWQWVTDVPVHLGGISHQWFGEGGRLVWHGIRTEPRHANEYHPPRELIPNWSSLTRWAVMETTNREGRTMNKQTDALEQAYKEYIEIIETLLTRIAADTAEKKDALRPREMVPQPVVSWGHVGDLGWTADQLQAISDRLFHEGEYA